MKYRYNRWTQSAWEGVHPIDASLTADAAREFVGWIDKGRKFEDADLQGAPSLEDYALGFLREYEGDFAFLVDMRRTAERGKELSIGGIRGVLNCIRAENSRQSRKAEQQAAPLPDVKTGRYCLLNPDTGLRRFYQVDRPDQGRWEGSTFLRELHIGGSDNGACNVRGHAEKAKTLGAIYADPDALARYGQETGTCGACGKTLTDPESVKRGIGPVCWAKGPEEGERTMALHEHIYHFIESCGANVCVECDDHKGLARCYCGWSADGGNGYTQLAEMGETIEEDGY